MQKQRVPHAIKSTSTKSKQRLTAILATRSMTYIKASKVRNATTATMKKAGAAKSGLSMISPASRWWVCMLSYPAKNAIFQMITKMHRLSVIVVTRSMTYIKASWVLIARLATTQMAGLFGVSNIINKLNLNLPARIKKYTAIAAMRLPSTK